MDKIDERAPDSAPLSSHADGTRNPNATSSDSEVTSSDERHLPNNDLEEAHTISEVGTFINSMELLSTNVLMTSSPRFSAITGENSLTVSIDTQDDDSYDVPCSFFEGNLALTIVPENGAEELSALYALWLAGNAAYRANGLEGPDAYQTLHNNEDPRLVVSRSESGMTATFNLAGLID